MKILHTSDIHLLEHGDERWKNLQKIMNICNEEKVNVLTICGDLFDENPKTDELRSYIPELFTGNDFEILIIPGNHDKEVCTDMHFGKNGRVLSDPSKPFHDKNENVKITGLPYEQIEKEKVLEKITNLREILSDDTVNILLYHGELLDAFFAPEDYGDEVGRHMPLKLSYLEELPINYVLAGHFHKRFKVWTLDNGGFFIYPGSPFPVKKNEVGRRKVNIFEVGEDPSPYELDSPFYELINVDLNPLENDDPLAEIEELLEKMESKAVPVLEVGGYINGEELGLTEVEFADQVRKIAREKSDTEGIVESKISPIDIREILENDLFKEFLEKMEEKNYSDEKKQELRNGAIKSMMEAGK